MNNERVLCFSCFLILGRKRKEKEKSMLAVLGLGIQVNLSPMVLHTLQRNITLTAANEVMR